MGISKLLAKPLDSIANRIIQKLNVAHLNSQPLPNESAINKTSVLENVPTKLNTQIVGQNWLINFENNTNSEHGEDGIITKIFEVLKPVNKWVCEFGAHDPEVISNTCHLIKNKNWQGVLIEADDFYFNKLKDYYQNNKNVYCLHRKVAYQGEDTLDNILRTTPIPENLDFMIIDIDGNDYHVWEAIETYKANVVMIEFNASIPTDVSFKQEKSENLNQGSSLKAMKELAETKGYKLIATTAWNAFFVKEEFFPLFHQEETKLSSMYVYPAKHPIWMRGFQLYDGSLVIGQWNEMLWHSIELHAPDYQVLPQSLRKFSRELAATEPVTKDSLNTYIEAANQNALTAIYNKPGNILSKHAANYYSRYGEDGILEKLCQLVQADNLYFVDVGAHDSITFSRSRNLSERHNWRGLLLENDLTLNSKLNKNNKNLDIKIYNNEYNFSDLSLNNIFEKFHVPQNLDVLILNDYGMEYYLWESLTNYSPKIVAVQFNPTIPNDIKFIQPASFEVHQGCSLRALYELAHYKNYELIAVTLDTAFFVQRKSFYRILETMQISYSDLDDIFQPYETQFFQLYDGTIGIAGLKHLLWHNIKIDEEKLQVVPKSLRTFHQFADKKIKKFFYRVP